jgi:hypothetical protein
MSNADHSCSEILSHALSSTAWLQGSWVRIQLGAWCMRYFCVFVVLCRQRGQPPPSSLSQRFYQMSVNNISKPAKQEAFDRSGLLCHTTTARKIIWNGRMWLMNLERRGNKWSFPNSRYHHRICLKRLREFTENLSKGRRFPGQD